MVKRKRQAKKSSAKKTAKKTSIASAKTPAKLTLFKKGLYLVLAVIVCNLAGVIGSFFTASSVSTWYPSLAKPFFTPPGWVFAPAWITLYVLMGVSAFLVFLKLYSPRKALREQAKGALYLFGFQLSLNALWSILFFGLMNPLLAFIEIIVLWLAILLTMNDFRKLSWPAFWLLVPYILWVTFASVLNFAIFWLN